MALFRALETVRRFAIRFLPASGRITWGGRAESDGRRRAMMFQRPVMLRRSAPCNVAYALAAAGVRREPRTPRIAQLLAQVELAHVADRPASPVRQNHRLKHRICTTCR
jgi:ABC-type taurine transport system ATPase subunit